MCDEFSYDCGDCGGEIIDPNGYCNDNSVAVNRKYASQLSTRQEHGMKMMILILILLTN